jgi:hypothetical protein
MQSNPPIKQYTTPSGATIKVYDTAYKDKTLQQALQEASTGKKYTIMKGGDTSATKAI